MANLRSFLVVAVALQSATAFAAGGEVDVLVLQHVYTPEHVEAVRAKLPAELRLAPGHPRLVRSKPGDVSMMLGQCPPGAAKPFAELLAKAKIDVTIERKEMPHAERGCPALASSKPVEETAVDAVALIAGGGATAEDGARALAKWRQREDALLEAVDPAEDFPRVFESAKVEGLKPGFHVVVLGVCAESEAAPMLELLKGIEPSIYARKVSWKVAAGLSPPCPELRPGWRVAELFHLTSKRGGIHAAHLTWTGKPGGRDWRLPMALTDAKGVVLDHDLLTSASLGEELLPNGQGWCPDATITSEGGRLIVESGTCEGPGCTVLDMATGRTTVTAGAGTLQVTTRRTQYRKGPCD